jgi:ATP-binding cassette, subfamily B, bacterial
MWGMSAVRPEDRLDRVQTVALLTRAVRFALPHRRHMLTALGCVTLVTIATLTGPVLVRHGIDAGVRAGDASALNAAVFGYVAVTLVSYLAARQQYLSLNLAGEGFLRDLRIRVFQRLQQQSLAFYDRYQAGVLVSRMTADIESMGELVQWGLLQFLGALMLLLLAIGLLLALSWQLTLVAFVVLPVIIAASVKFQRDSNRAYLEVREQVGANLSNLQEGITAVRVIQAFGAQQRQRNRFEQSNRSLHAAHLRSVRVSTWYFGLVELAGVVATALLVGIGGWLVHRGSVSVGTVVAFVLLVASLFDPVQQLSQLYNSLQSAAAALHKLFGILDHEPEVADHPDAVDLPEHGPLVLDRVGFTYPGTSQAVLHSITLRVEPGQRLALVGPTGAGKSTLAKLMARLYDPVDGSVSWGGVDLRDASLHSLRQRVVVVPQEGFLFDGSIADNIRIARPDATDHEVRAALDAIGVRERFEALPEGLATEVRERGSRLSAGERQLVSLARVAMVDPAVLVLDEATSNLDPGTEADVERALDHLMRQRTVVVVAHRLSTVRSADLIAVVADGGIVELGTHDELLARQGRYAALSQAYDLLA